MISVYHIFKTEKHLKAAVVVHTSKGSGCRLIRGRGSQRSSSHGNTNRKADPMFLSTRPGWAHSLALAAMSAETLLGEGGVNSVTRPPRDRQRSCHLLHSLLTPGAKEHSHKFLSEKEGGILCPCLKIKSWGDSTRTAGAIPDHHHQGASRIASHCFGSQPAVYFQAIILFLFCFVSLLFSKPSLT